MHVLKFNMNNMVDINGEVKEALARSEAVQRKPGSPQVTRLMMNWRAGLDM